MKDRTLYRICLIFSGISIVAMLTFSTLTETQKMSIGGIDGEEVGDTVKVEGEIKSVKNLQGGHILFHVKDKTGAVDVILFKNQIERMDLDKNQITVGKEIVVEGEVDRYDDSLEILPEEIVL